MARPCILHQTHQASPHVLDAWFSQCRALERWIVAQGRQPTNLFPLPELGKLMFRNGGSPGTKTHRHSAYRWRDQTFEEDSWPKDHQGHETPNVTRFSKQTNIPHSWCQSPVMQVCLRSPSCWWAFSCLQVHQVILQARWEAALDHPWPTESMAYWQHQKQGNIPSNAT